MNSMRTKKILKAAAAAAGFAVVMFVPTGCLATGTTTAVTTGGGAGASVPAAGAASGGLSGVVSGITGALGIG